MADGTRERFIEPGWGVGSETERDRKLPDKILDMPVTEELRAMYKGFPELVLVRATLSKRCRAPFDATTLCVRQQLDATTCTDVFKAWAPCEEEIRRKRIKAARIAEEEERKKLSAASRRP